MNHRLFIIRLLEVLARGKERICLCESDEYPDGRVEIRPHGEANGELYGHVQFYEDRSCLSFYKENPALIVRFMGEEPDQVLETVMATEKGVWFSPVYQMPVFARYENIPYDESMGFIQGKPL